MAEEKDDKKFRAALEASRHEEISSLLKQLIEASKKDTSKDSEIVTLLKKNEKGLEAFLLKLSEVSAPVIEAPSVTVNDNDDDVIRAVNESKSEIIKALSEQNSLLKELIQIRKADVEMIPQMDGFGRIKKVTAKLSLNN